MSSPRRPRPFLARPRQFRKAQAFAVRQLFACAGDPDAVCFATDAALDAETCVADIVFLSPRDKAIVYQGRLSTAAATTLDVLDDLAGHYVYGPQHVAAPTPLRKAAFAAERLRLLEQGAARVFEGVWLDRRCPHAVGVEGIVDAPALTAETVSRFIERFWAAGERGFASPWVLGFAPAVLDETQLPPAPQRIPLPAALTALRALAAQIEALPREHRSAGTRRLRRFLPRD